MIIIYVKKDDVDFEIVNYPGVWMDLSHPVLPEQRIPQISLLLEFASIRWNLSRTCFLPNEKGRNNCVHAYRMNGIYCGRENSRLKFQFHAHAKRSRRAPVWMEYRTNS